MSKPVPVNLDDDSVQRLAQATADAMPRPGVPWTSAQRWADASSAAADVEAANRAFVDSYCRAGTEYSNRNDTTGAPIDPSFQRAVTAPPERTTSPSVTASQWATAITGPVENR